MKDRKRYSEAFKLKVMEELRDAKWKSVQEAARAYGIAEMSVYNWMHRLGFEHLKGRLIYVRTRPELDRIKELEEQALCSDITYIYTAIKQFQLSNLG